jgi:hypothetical protein
MALPSSLTTARKIEIERSVGAKLDATLAADLRSALGASFDATKLLTVKATVGTALRSQLGVTLGTRADASIGAGAAVAGDVSLGVSLGASADAAAGVTATLSASLGLNLEAALLGLGLSPSEREAVLGELTPALTGALEGSLRSAIGASPGYPSAAGARLLNGQLKLLAEGTWRAYLSVDLPDDAPVPSGPYTFEIEGQEWRGTVVPARSGAFGGRTAVAVVGGAGGLSADLQVKNYSRGVTLVRTIVEDILREAGEELSDESDQSLLGKQLPSWQRSRGPAQVALPQLLRQFGAAWRVLRDGKVWVGIDSWPEVELNDPVEDDDWSDGVIVTAPETTAMVPGVTCRGRRIEQVVYNFDFRGLRCELHSRSLASTLADKLVARARRETEFAYRYRCRVVRQNGNGTVDVDVDDERMKGRGVGNCRVRAGLPGVRLVVPKGARCLVGWDDGDPSLPYVDGWESEAPFTSIDIG